MNLLVRIFNKVLSRFGYHLEKNQKIEIKSDESFRFSPLRNTMEESLKHLKNLDFSPQVIIDVGTANGTQALLNVYPDATYYWIEPLMEFEKDLIELKNKYNGEYFIAAAGKDEDEIIINVHNDLVGSSIFNESDGKKADGDSRKIKQLTLDKLLFGKISESIILKIDVQGAELNVLEGAKELISKCEAIILEISFFRFLKNAPEFYSVIEYMKQKNFVVYDIFDGHNRPLDNALAQKDILFVKEDGIFRKSHNWAKPEQIE